MMIFLNDNDIRFGASVLAGTRTLLALPDAASVIHVHELIDGALKPPADLPEPRMPGPKHSCAWFDWQPVGGREQLRLWYGSRPDGATTGPFYLTYQDLPYFRPSLSVVNQELVRLRGLLEQAGAALGQALP